jgi:hypothetical protein
VAQSKPGAPPRRPGGGKGLPEVRFRVDMQVGVLTHRKFDLAKQKLAAERGAVVDDAQCLDVLAGLFLDLEEDGSVEGRNRVRSSLYRIVLREDASAPGELLADTELGPVPVEEQACIRCDADVVAEGVVAESGYRGRKVADGVVRDRPTPPALRSRVLARDGHQCRHCRSREQLMVHHIEYRSKGGRTQAANLVTLCVRCHSLVHADLLLLEGASAYALSFKAADSGGVDSSGAGSQETPRRGLVMAAGRPAPSCRSPRCRRVGWGT